MSTHSIPYQYIHVYKKKRKSPEIIPNILMSAAVEIFCLGLKNEFEIAVVNKPPVFEPLTFYCTSSCKIYEQLHHACARSTMILQQRTAIQNSHATLHSAFA